MDREERFCCAEHVGSNYVLFKIVSEDSVTRVHFNELKELCRKELQPEVFIAEQVKLHQVRVQDLLGQVRRLTEKLCVGVRPSILGVQEETQSLATIGGAQQIEKHKRALTLAKEKTLPDLFQRVKEENEQLAIWMQASLLPLKGQVASMKGVISLIDDRIFHVSLYAGLVEEVEQVRKGAPAGMDEPLWLMQRRHYMDEECLIDYQSGGMCFKKIEEFDAWLGRPEVLQRIFPFPRCLVAFRVRRKEKDRDSGEAHSLWGFIRFTLDAEADRSTFLYIRNGEQIFRLQTEIDFDEKLFPDLKKRELGLGGEKLWGKKFCGIDELITDAEYQGKLEVERLLEAQREAAPEDEQWRYRSRIGDYEPFTPESVYYDDMTDMVKNQIKDHNRLVLLIQGLLDRSAVLHPHPPWRLWEAGGFEAAIRLVYDDSRALSDGDKPDFEAYRAELNRSLSKGSITCGQQIAWELKEGEKESARRSWRNQHGSPKRFDPYGNPGPGDLARVVRFSLARNCFYEWRRDRLLRRWRDQTKDLRATFTCPGSAVLNVSAYKKGDYLRFYRDPRTRAEYLQWAPLLLAAEEFAAGNRKVG